MIRAHIIKPPTRQLIEANLREALTSFGTTLSQLTPEQWLVPSLCPAWDVRGVAVHVLTIESVLSGWTPSTTDNPFTRAGTVAEELHGLDPAALVNRYHEVVGARLAEIGAMSDEVFNGASFTPVGPATYGRFMAIRTFDVWVHERDIRVPLEIPGDDGGAVAEMSLDEVHASFGFIVGKKIGLPDGKSIAVEVVGPCERTMLAKVDGRAVRVDELERADVTLSTDSLTFMLLACGRIDPDAAVQSGAIRWTGDEVLGAHAARHLAFTM